MAKTGSARTARKSRSSRREVQKFTLCLYPDDSLVDSDLLEVLNLVRPGEVSEFMKNALVHYAGIQLQADQDNKDSHLMKSLLNPFAAVCQSRGMKELLPAPRDKRLPSPKIQPRQKAAGPATSDEPQDADAPEQNSISIGRQALSDKDTIADEWAPGQVDADEATPAPIPVLEVTVGPPTLPPAVNSSDEMEIMGAAQVEDLAPPAAPSRGEQPKKGHTGNGSSIEAAQRIANLFD